VLLATAGGALLGWGVIQLKGGAAALTHAPPSLALVDRRPADPPDPLGSAEPARRNRHVRLSQGSNSPDRTSYPGTPRLAIVIDDIGQSLSAPRELLSLGVPITFSVLPDLPHSRQAAELIARSHREFIIHLPMEPLDYPTQNPGPRPLLLSLDANQTRRRMDGYLRELPGAVGASNHMGSAYTADPERMALVQELLAERQLFFLNSKTSPTPVPAAVARRGRFAYLERDVFLDNERDPSLITRALNLAIFRARRNGQAIAIGHPYPETVQVLNAALSGPTVRGVELVSLSDLLER
jgi:hypothetical protein